LKGRAAYLVGRSLDDATPAWLVRGLVSFFSDTWIKDKEVLAGRTSEAAPKTKPGQGVGQYL
jgi:hypothetical protein